MSILEKTISILETMPNDKIETVYAFVRFIDSDTYESPSEYVPEKNPCKIDKRKRDQTAHQLMADALRFQRKQAIELVPHRSGDAADHLINPMNQSPHHIRSRRAMPQTACQKDDHDIH